MNRESFLEAVRQQYAEEIHEAYLECEHEDGRNVDFKGLNSRLQRLMKNATVEGLQPDDFVDLVRSTLPEVADRVDLTSTRKAA